MNRLAVTLVIVAIVVIGTVAGVLFILQPDAAYQPENASPNRTIALPDPMLESETSVEEALSRRRSLRSYRDEPPTLSEIAQLLWAAQGITDPSGQRTAPSAGALYPLEIYIVAGDVVGLPAGIYRYQPQEHTLTRVAEGDRRGELYRATLNQEAVMNAPAVIVLSGVYARTTTKYGERGVRYVLMEAGHVAENIYLQAVPLDLGTVAIGAFADDEVRGVLHMVEGEHPLYVMPVGRR